MSIKYLTHAAVIRCTHGGLLQLLPPLRRSLYSGGSPIVSDADVLAGKIIGCPEPFKPCLSVVGIIAGLADKVIVDGQIPILMTLQALTDGGASCSPVFDPVTKLETDAAAVWLARSPDLAKPSWWRGQWNDFVRMFTDPASLTGLLVGLVLAILAVLLIPAGLTGLTLALLTLGVAALIGMLSALAATVVSNLQNGLHWNSNLLRVMLHGAGIGIAFAAAGIALEAAGLAIGSAGFIAAMAAVGAGIGIISNKLAGRPWDESLLANGGLAAGFAALGKFLPKVKTAEEPEAALPFARDALLKQLRLRARQLELSKDPERGGIIDEREGAGAVHIEQALGRSISRGGEKGVDFVDRVLGKLSLKGPLPASGGSTEGLSKSAIKDATQQSATKVLFVDLTGLTPKQAAAVKAAVSSGAAGSHKQVLFLE